MENKKVRIAHSLEDLEDQIILTLKDKPILNKNQIDQEDDLLQNQDIYLLNKATHHAQLKKKIKQMINPQTSHIQAKMQGNSSILPQYDDHTYKNDQIQLQSSGKFKIKKGKGFKSNVQLDFMNQQQGQITKIGAQYVSSKAKKINRQQQSNKNLLDFLNQTAQQPQIKNDLKRQAETIFQDSISQIKKKRILQQNLQKQIVSVNISSLIQNDQEQLLKKSIQRNRKQFLKKNVLDIIKQENNEQNQEQTQVNNVQIQLNPISYQGDDKKYIRKQLNFKQVKNGTTSSMFINLPSEKLKKKEENIQFPQSFKEISKEQLQKMKEQVSFLQDKSLGIGLTDTLNFLRQNSLLKKEEQVGRSTDKTIDYQNNPNDRIKLQYRNASGKLMKPKQAFRYLCANFHGEGPGKNKIQKRKKKELQQMRMKQRSNTGGTLMNLLSKHQQKTSNPYMIIDFGNKKTSK